MLHQGKVRFRFEQLTYCRKLTEKLRNSLYVRERIRFSIAGNFGNLVVDKGANLPY